MVDPENPGKPVEFSVVPKNLMETIGTDAFRAGPYAVLLLFAIWWLNSQWQADKLVAATDLRTAIAANADAVKKQAEQAAIQVKELAVQQTIQLKDQAEHFEQQQSRTERLLTNKSDQNAAKINEVAKKVDSFGP